MLIFTLFLTGCSTHINHYKTTTPDLVLEEFYNGKLAAYGMVQNRSGEVIRRFKADLTGTWQGKKGKLEEIFFYDDGETQERVWYLEKVGKNQYIGTADDVSVDAVGQVSGYALNWEYTLQIKVDGAVYDVDFNDWMYLLDEKRLINRAEMTKWGFKVGEVTLWIEKLDNSKYTQQTAPLDSTVFNTPSRRIEAF